MDQELLEILVCPQSRTRLIHQGDWLYSTDQAAPQKYPIRDGIPILLIEEAQAVPPEEFQRVMTQAGGPAAEPAPLG